VIRLHDCDLRWKDNIDFQVGEHDLVLALSLHGHKEQVVRRQPTFHLTVKSSSPLIVVVAQRSVQPDARAAAPYSVRSTCG